MKNANWPKTVRCFQGCAPFNAEKTDVWHSLISKPIGMAEHLVCRCPGCGFYRNFERYDPVIHKDIPTENEWNRTHGVGARS